MPTFKAPLYSKKPNASTGVLEPYYTFPITFSNSDEKVSYTAEDQSEISLKKLQETIIENLDWWKQFVGLFISSTSKFFAKPYTFDTINKMMKHTLSSNEVSIDYPAVLMLYPNDIVFYQNSFIVNWKYDIEKMLISITEQEDSIENTIISNNKVEEVDDKANNRNILDSSTKNEINGISIEEKIEELNIDDIPDDKESTDMELHIDNPSRYYDKQRVKEARLRAKLALYKAERQMTKYYEKYGNDISDSDSSDYETSDDETEVDED